MNLNSKNRNGGFSLVEVMMTVTIIAILSTTVTISISGYVLERKGEAIVMAFYSQLQQLKAFSQRDNDRYLVVLRPSSAPAFEIYRDVDKTYNINSISGDPGKKVQLFVDQTNVANNIEFISPSSVNAGKIDICMEGVCPPNAYTSADAIVGEWKNPELAVPSDLVPVPSNNMIIFENDEISTISKGIVFLKNKSVKNNKNICYAIACPENENTLKLFKWKSGSWTEL